MRTTLLILFGLFPLLPWAQVNPITQSGTPSISLPMIVGKISFDGNKTTKSNIISREIIIKEGDTLQESVFKSKLEQSRLNLLNTSLFNFVTIDTTLDLNGSLNLKFKMIERWYLFPFPIFEISDRNFNSWLEHRDWRRVNYGAFIKWSNLRGRMEVLNLLIRFGYDERYRLAYDLPYINAKQTLGLSFSASINQNHEVAYKTENNAQIFYRGENYMFQNYLISTTLNYRPSIFNSFSANLGFNRIDYNSKLTELNTSYAPIGTTQLKLIKTSFYYRNDHRDNKAYPIDGYFADAEITTLNGSYSNNKEYSNSYLYSNLSIFDHFTQRWSWSAGTTFKISKNEIEPFFFNQGLGYRSDYVRGYEYYVIDGGKYFLAKSNIKYNLIKPQTNYLKLTGTERFDKFHYAVYLNIFADIGEVFSPALSDVQTLSLPETKQPLNKKLLRGVGFGLDLVTYYDKVLRFEYSFNHFGQGGFFIHFESPL